MRVLLISANRSRVPVPVAPLGLGLVAAATAAGGHEVRVLDLCFSRHAEAELARVLREWQPEVIGLSVRNLDNGESLHPVSHLPEAERFAQVCRAHSSALLIIGGAAVNVAPEETRRRLGADCALVGEGEVGLPEVLGRVEAGIGVQWQEAGSCPTRRAEGLWQEAGSCPTRLAEGLWQEASSCPTQRAEGLWQEASSCPTWWAEELDALPHAEAGKWIDLPRYLRQGASYPVQSKRGCAFHCTYCSYPLIEGGSYRLRSPESVGEEVAGAIRRWRVRRFEFVDSTFNHPFEHALRMCEELARRRFPAAFSTMGLNPSTATPELFGAMRAAGFSSAVCAAESGSNRMLEGMRKGFAAEQVARAAVWAREAGLSVLWSFLLGGPGESEDTVRETVRFMERAFGPQDRFICTVGLRVYPRTGLAKVAMAEGAIAADADLSCPVFYQSPQISAARTLELLDASPRRGQMVLLETIQRPAVARAMRLRRALRLPGEAWASVPLYNCARRLLGRR